uniref:Putative secreted protein n=1 Tax=Ixodes ricinus TaxID=34613 RepID=A0A6B0UKQ0_IXORI
MALNVAATAPFTRWGSWWTSRLTGRLFLLTIQAWPSTSAALYLCLGSTWSIFWTRCFAGHEMLAQFPDMRSNRPSPILANMWFGVSLGPLAKGVCPASIVYSSTPMLQMSQASS